MYRPRQLVINSTRLMDTLHNTCVWGAAHRYGPGPTQTGMARLTLSDDDKKARDWFGDEMSSLGCDIKVDTMGNMFAVRPGEKTGAPTAIGSHLDTQPTGGRYDGILGVHAAVEAMRTIHESGYKTQYPIAAVNWTNEEGARFPKSLHGSSVWSGDFTVENAHALTDVADSSITAGAELERIGYKGTLECSAKANPLAAHFELHIEQGPILENNKQTIGIVNGGQAYKWFNVRVHGRDSHAGTTPMNLRADPLLLSARLMVAANAVAIKHGGCATTGIMSLKPGSINTIPNLIDYTLDIRHPDDAALAAMEADIRAAAAALVAEESRYKCTIELDKIFDYAATKFHPDCIGAVRTAAEATVGADMAREIVSGAGHDSCATSKHCPTSMVFIPCEEGLSHNPREYATPEDCALGAQVVMDAALLFDSRRQK